jgi:nucleotide-binding universal stress UspA family protein
MSFEKILVAIDGSDCSDHAFATALELAALANARLTALAVEGPLPAYEEHAACTKGSARPPLSRLEEPSGRKHEPEDQDGDPDQVAHEHPPRLHAGFIGARRTGLKGRSSPLPCLRSETGPLLLS